MAEIDSSIIYGYTALDKDIIGNNRFADPLGVQPIWSWFGRFIVPHLTEQTHSAYGFNMLILIFYLYDEYRIWRKDEDKKILSIEEFYIYFEQLFAFSVFYTENKWELPGERRLKHFFNINDDPRYFNFGKDRQILGSQLSNGTWGLYRGAAIRSGLLNTDGRSLNPEVLLWLRSESKQPEIINNKKQLFEKVQELTSESNAQINLRSKPAESIYSSFKKMNKKILKEYLFNKQDPLTYQVAEKLSGENVPIDYRAFLNWCRSKFNSNQEIFEEIIYCEDYIGTLDSIMMFLYDNEDEDISFVANTKLKIDLDKLRRTKFNFENKTVPPKQGIALSRYKLFNQTILVDNKLDLLRSVLQLHTAVMQQRGGSAWIVEEYGKVKVYNDYISESELKVTPGKGWKNPYYLDTLKSVYEDLY